MGNEEEFFLREPLSIVIHADLISQDQCQKHDCCLMPNQIPIFMRGGSIIWG